MASTQFELMVEILYTTSNMTNINTNSSGSIQNDLQLEAQSLRIENKCYHVIKDYNKLQSGKFATSELQEYFSYPEISALNQRYRSCSSSFSFDEFKI